MIGLKYKIFTWDWKDQPNWAAITLYCHELRSQPFFHYVNTSEDDNAVLIANASLQQEQVEEYYALRNS